jgi:hypothetical protein
MSKPNIQNVTTTQTFQNWLDKTNEMVNIFRDSAITASVSGDSTSGDANLIGEFGANTIVAYPSLHADEFIATTPGGSIDFGSPIEITGAASEIVATFNFGGSGAKTRFTEGTNSWDTGINNVSDQDFVMGYNGADLFKLSPSGVLTVDSIVAETGISVAGGDIAVDNLTVAQSLTANNATIQSLTSNNIRGQFTGDIYHPAGNKIFENGGPAANVPATFTGNVNGTVSSLTNHKTTNLTEGTNLYFTRLRVRETLTQGTGVGITIDPNDSTKTVIGIGQAVNITSNVQFASVTASGNITAYGTVSDITTKENINPITNALDKISQLGGYTFNYKGDETPMTGVMAQELQKVLPEAVYETQDPKTKETVFAVRHGNVIGLLIEAIKELQEKVGK